MRFIGCLPILTCAALLISTSQAQDDNPSGRRAPASKATREFLGLGPAPDEQAAKRGEPLYRQNCATCHGPTARGAQGPSLVRSPLVLHDEHGNDIAPVVKQGRPQSGMPPFADLAADQVRDIAEFIHLQIELTANRGTYRDTYDKQRNQLTGDADKGKAFFAANCTACHSATGDLAKIGAKYSQPAELLNRIAWPTSRDPKQATVHTQNGENVSGTLLEFTDFDVALRDSAGQYHYWPRESVTVDMPDKLSGHRALLPKYTDADLHNLTAYLVTLK